MGWGDPLALLRLERHDYAIAVAVIEKAQELQAGRDKALIEAQAQQTANRVVPGLAKILGRLIEALAKSMTRQRGG